LIQHLQFFLYFNDANLFQQLWSLTLFFFTKTDKSFSLTVSSVKSLHCTRLREVAWFPTELFRGVRNLFLTCGRGFQAWPSLWLWSSGRGRRCSVSSSSFVRGCRGGLRRCCRGFGGRRRRRSSASWTWGSRSRV